MIEDKLKIDQTPIEAPPHPIIAKSGELRKKVEIVKQELEAFLAELKDPNREVASVMENKGEQIANAILAFWHLENAKMRIGKVIQATTGQSIYDK